MPDDHLVIWMQIPLKSYNHSNKYNSNLEWHAFHDIIQIKNDIL